MVFDENTQYHIIFNYFYQKVLLQAINVHQILLLIA